jgi:carboxyl-terminal processing protease
MNKRVESNSNSVNKTRVALLIIVSVVFLPSCIGYNLKKKSWTDAFTAMHADFSREYPFTEWKKINMDSLFTVTAEEIQSAEKENNREKYQVAVRNYSSNIHDLHTFVITQKLAKKDSMVEGSYGFGIVKLESGSVIVHYLSETGTAKKSGMQWGAKIVQWNGNAITEAIDGVSLLWIDQQPATEDGILLKKSQYLLRDPLHTKSTVTFVNPGDTQQITVTLETRYDAFNDLIESSMSRIPAENIVGSRTTYHIDDDYAYIRIRKFMPSLTEFNVYGKFKKALKKIIRANPKGIIIDVRGNQGGVDALIPKMAGHFVREKSIYEYISTYKAGLDSFTIDSSNTLTIVPREPYYNGKIVVVIDNNTASTAEGLPMVVQKLDNGFVMGQYSSAGSFAMGYPPKLYRLPEDVFFGFLNGRSLDENKHIQIDGNHENRGGVHPDIAVPVTYENIHARFVKKEDVILQAAIRFITRGERPDPKSAQ